VVVLGFLGTAVRVRPAYPPKSGIRRQGFAVCAAEVVRLKSYDASIPLETLNKLFIAAALRHLGRRRRPDTPLTGPSGMVARS